MPRLPLCNAEEIREELNEIDRVLRRLADIYPRCTDAAHQQAMSRQRNELWRADLTAQLEELEGGAAA